MKLLTACLTAFFKPSIFLIEVFEGLLTFIVTDAFFPLPSFATAVILAFPTPNVVTTPFELTLATFVLDDFHVTFCF